MLRQPWLVARKSCLRSLSTAAIPPRDELERALQGVGDPLPSAQDDEHVPEHAPTGPAGVLPVGGTPQQSDPTQLQKKHSLPDATDSSIYHLHVKSSRNNVILTLTNALGNPLAWVSAGSCGFKHVQRSGYEAGYQCAVKMFGMIAKVKEEQHQSMRLELLFKGFGNGREAFYRALMTAEGDKIRDTIFRLTDTTPLKIGGGTRAPKARRL